MTSARVSGCPKPFITMTPEVRWSRGLDTSVQDTEQLTLHELYSVFNITSHFILNSLSDEINKFPFNT